MKRALDIVQAPIAAEDGRSRLGSRTGAEGSKDQALEKDHEGDNDNDDDDAGEGAGMVKFSVC